MKFLVYEDSQENFDIIECEDRDYETLETYQNYVGLSDEAVEQLKKCLEKL